MPYQVDDALLHAMSGTELSRVRTELRLLPEPNNQRLLMSRGADIVMQSSANYSATLARTRLFYFLVFVFFNSYFENKNTLHSIL